MLKAIERVAGLAVPTAFRLDPANRSQARQVRSAASVAICAMGAGLLTLIVFVVTSAFVPNDAQIWLVAAIASGGATLALVRVTAHLTPALCFGGSLATACMGMACAFSGGLASPFLAAFISLPTLTVGFEKRAPLAASAGACLVLLAILTRISLNAETGLDAPGTPDLAHIIGIAFALALLGIAAFSVRVTLGKAQTQALDLHKALSQKTAASDALTSKMAKYLPPQAFASVFENELDIQLGATRKKLTVYFADLVDFTEATDALEPEELAQLMNEYFAHMAEIVTKHGGTLDKYIGDAILVFFGDPETKGASGDAIACVEMALEMESRINLLRDKWLAMGVSRPLQMRAGINTGYCTIGNFGSENRMDYTIIGGQVNIASRLEQAAKPGTILISHQTHALVRDHFDCEELGSIQVKGIREPVKSYQVGAPSRQGDKEALIHDKLNGMSLVIDPNALSAEDRHTARRYLERAIERLKN